MKKTTHIRISGNLFLRLFPLFSLHPANHTLSPVSQLLSRLVLLVSTDDAIINQRKERCGGFCFVFLFSTCTARSSESDAVKRGGRQPLCLPAPPPTTPTNGRGSTGHRARSCVAIMRSTNPSAVSGSDSLARVESSGLHLQPSDRQPTRTGSRTGNTSHVASTHTH